MFLTFNVANERRKTIILIDASHLLLRNFFMNKKEIVEFRPNEHGESKPTGKINEGFLIHVVYSSILTLANKFKASESNPVIVALDSKPSWRHEYYVKHSKNFPEYKGETYKGNRKKDSEIPWNKIWQTFDIAMANLTESTDFNVVKVDLAEADDVIAILALNADEEVYVCSSDKDFHQLQAPHIHIYDPIKRIIIPPIDVERRKQLHFLTAGDDNIKQVKPRMGKKTAEKIINEGLDTYLQINPEVRERYEFNRNLIDFDYIPKNVGDSILQAVDVENNFCYNTTSLMAFFSEYQMKLMLGKMQSFKLKGKQLEAPNLKIKTEKVKKSVDTSIEEFFTWES